MFAIPLAYSAYYGAARSPQYSPLVLRSVDAARKFAQGAGSALLMFAGANSMGDGAEAGGGVAPVVDFSSLNGIAESLATGGLNGPFQIAGAIFLFLAAGKCVARFAGFLLAAAMIALYLQGVTLNDVWLFFARFAARLDAAITAFQAAQVA